MAIATLTSKGQMTIPMDIRLHLDLHIGDKIDFVIEKDGKVVIEPLTSDIKELKGFFGKPKKIVSVEQMNAAIIKRGSSL